MATSAGLFSRMAGALSTATIRWAGGRNGSDMAQRPAPTSRTVPPMTSDSRARRCDREMSECLLSKSATGRTQGSSRAWERIRSGIAHDASACFQRVAAVAAWLTSTLGRPGRCLVRNVGQTLKRVGDRESRAYDDDGNWAELAERNESQVDDRADGEARPCS